MNKIFFVLFLSYQWMAYSSQDLLNNEDPWLKEHLKKCLDSKNFFQSPLDFDSSSKKECQSCSSVTCEENFPLYVFMSFSLEDNLWIQFSEELEKIGGVFVIRGLPQNSFKELAKHIYELKEKGVLVPVQIHPKLFHEFDIQLVPSIVVRDEKRYDKISGNLSIKCALEKMSQQGETKQARVIYEKLEKS